MKDSSMIYDDFEDYYNFKYFEKCSNKSINKINKKIIKKYNKFVKKERKSCNNKECCYNTDDEEINKK